MKSILFLLFICFVLLGIMAVCYWIPRHLILLHLSEKSLRLLPGEEKKLPSINYQLKKGKSTIKNLSQKLFSLENGILTGIYPGKGLLFICKKYRRKWEFGWLTIHVDEKPIFFRHPLLVHALGGLENEYTYCNALEGLEQSLARNVPFIETDMILTSDQHLVCSHGWNKKTYRLTGVPYPAKNPVMSYETFMSTKIHGKFTAIDSKKIADTMKKHKKLLVELDLRTINKDTARKTCEKLIEAFDQRDDLLCRLLIQVGSPEMYEGIDSVYHFPYYQYFLHKDEALDPLPVIEFCCQKGIISLAVKDTYFTPEIQELCRKNGLCILVYTVDDPMEAKKFLDAGADTICSNFLTPQDLTNI